MFYLALFQLGNHYGNYKNKSKIVNKNSAADIPASGHAYTAEMNCLGNRGDCFSWTGVHSSYASSLLLELALPSKLIQRGSEAT